MAGIVAGKGGGVVGKGVGIAATLICACIERTWHMLPWIIGKLLLLPN